MNEGPEKGLRPIAVRSFQSYGEMYKVVDFLNKTLKEKRIMFGLSKNDQGTMVITIYEF